MRYTVLCKHCNARMQVSESASDLISCKECSNNLALNKEDEVFEELDFYPIDPPFSYISINKNQKTFQKIYQVHEPFLAEDEQKVYDFIRKELMTHFTMRLDELEDDAESFLLDHYVQVKKEYRIKLDDIFEKKLWYYIKRFFLGYDVIEPLMRDSRIEDISCDGAKGPLFINHRDYGSLQTSIVFESENLLTEFVIKLAQKCGKHISVSKPMLDATMPDGSRIQMTLSGEVTTKGSTFTIRKFKSDPITPVDLIQYHSMSSEILAYLWLAVEHGSNALISGGTASGKTSALNAMCLFIPREAKIVSIEETREINLPHPNWIPGITRSGFGEIVKDRYSGEIDLFDLMKAALRQRPEYILVGEIRGKEAYVLFQAMATGHTTYSTVHADSMKALVHRLEGKPINVPRNMLQSLDIVIIQSMVKVKGQLVRRCKEIIEMISVDAETNEFLTNTVFKWDPSTDEFNYTGKSYILEKIREQRDYSTEGIRNEIKQRQRILEWMQKYTIRDFGQVGYIVASYSETPDHMLSTIQDAPSKEFLSHASEVAIASSTSEEMSSLFEVPLPQKESVQNESNKKSGLFKKKLKNWLV